MMTVNEASKLTGVSIRALQYYDTIGLLPPAGYTEAGYRLYDDTAMERLQQSNASSILPILIEAKRWSSKLNCLR